MVIVNRQSSFYIRKCLLLLTVFQVIYISSILFRVHCRVNSGGKVKRYDIATIMRSDIEKLYFSRCIVISYLRYFLQRSNNYQPFDMCYFTFIQCKYIIICTTLLSCCRCGFFSVFTTCHWLHKHFYYLFYYDYWHGSNLLFSFIIFK